MDFLFRDKAIEVHKEECRDIPNSCRDTDQAHGNETQVVTLIKHMAMKLMLQHLTTFSKHKELTRAEELCHDKRQLFRDTKSIVSFNE